MGKNDNLNGLGTPALYQKIPSLMSDADMCEVFHIRNQYFKMSSGAHHMDNRFPPVEREAWIILFVVNLSEA